MPGCLGENNEESCGRHSLVHCSPADTREDEEEDDEEEDDEEEDDEVEDDEEEDDGVEAETDG